MPKFFILSGGGASRKSTLLAYLGRCNDVGSYGEVGSKVFRRWIDMYNFEGKKFDAINVPAEYDLEIVWEEIVQGMRMSLDKNKFAIVETGIVGDLAYVKSRNPDLYDRFLNNVDVIECINMFRENGMGVLLNVDDEILNERILNGKHRGYIPKEMGVDEFVAVQRRLYNLNKEVYDDLGISYVEVDNNGGIWDTCVSIDREAFNGQLGYRQKEGTINIA